MGSETPLEIPKINLSSVNPAGDGWGKARTEVMQALVSYGCFDAVYDAITPELQEAFFGQALKELFSLPKGTKMLNRSEMIVSGYIGNLPDKAYESLYIEDVVNLGAADQFTHLMWPAGNPTFRDTVWEFGNKLKDLDQIVRRMIAESYGVETNKYESHVNSTHYGIRMAHYGVPSEEQCKTGMGAHKDIKFIGIVCQHQVAGLEVQSRDGGWIRVLPSPNTFTVMLGESMEVWTNGRLRAPVHKVRIGEKEERYSAVFGPRPMDGYKVQVPEELVDEEHPLLYENFDYNEYMLKFASMRSAKPADSLKLYCGVGGNKC